MLTGWIWLASYVYRSDCTKACLVLTQSAPHEVDEKKQKYPLILSLKAERRGKYV